MKNIIFSGSVGSNGVPGISCDAWTKGQGWDLVGENLELRMIRFDVRGGYLERGVF